MPPLKICRRKHVPIIVLAYKYATACCERRRRRCARSNAIYWFLSVKLRREHGRAGAYLRNTASRLSVKYVSRDGMTTTTTTRASGYSRIIIIINHETFTPGRSFYWRDRRIVTMPFWPWSIRFVFERRSVRVCVNTLRCCSDQSTSYTNDKGTTGTTRFFDYLSFFLFENYRWNNAFSVDVIFNTTLYVLNAWFYAPESVFVFLLLNSRIIHIAFTNSLKFVPHFSRYDCYEKKKTIFVRKEILKSLYFVYSKHACSFRPWRSWKQVRAPRRLFFGYRQWIFNKFWDAARINIWLTNHKNVQIFNGESRFFE